MINWLIRWCLSNHFLVFLFALVLIGLGYFCLTNTPVDAIPDIGEKQVIVFADWPGRSPHDVENQVTYPLTVSLQGTPSVKTIRSMSGFGFSMVFVIFKDEADYYWARSRVLERMNVADVTVRHHLTSIFAKLEVPDRLSLVVFAYHHALAHPSARWQKRA